MSKPEELVEIEMTREEAEELYYQCLRRVEPDTPAGESIFHKLAAKLEFERI